jgi:hypothetical protein
MCNFTINRVKTFNIFFELDSPLNDGFGVVIVTICIQKSGDILLLSNESSKTWVFNAPEGSLYVLSGPARSACDHGVVVPLERRRKRESSKWGSAHDHACPPPKVVQRRKSKTKNVRAERPGRESLNLRFALHGNVPSKQFFVGEEMPLFSA